MPILRALAPPTVLIYHKSPLMFHRCPEPRPTCGQLLRHPRCYSVAFHDGNWQNHCHRPWYKNTRQQDGWRPTCNNTQCSSWSKTKTNESGNKKPRKRSQEWKWNYKMLAKFYGLMIRKDQSKKAKLFAKQMKEYGFCAWDCLLWVTHHVHVRDSKLKVCEVCNSRYCTSCVQKPPCACMYCKSRLCWGTCPKNNMDRQYDAVAPVFWCH